MAKKKAPGPQRRKAASVPLASKPGLLSADRVLLFFLLLAILSISLIRLNLASLPLERDEGEYAYMGQLILKGIPPYSIAYNMKLPGTYYMYALVMALFGQTPAGIHTGLALVNAG